MKVREAAGVIGHGQGGLRRLGWSSHCVRYFYSFLLFSVLGTLLIWLALASPAYSHWADLAVTEIIISENKAQVTLTFPTGLVAFADDNGDGQLSMAEVRTHEVQLRAFLGDRIRLTNSRGAHGTLTIQHEETGVGVAAPALQASTHSTLLLDYTWPQPVGDLRIEYNLFLPGVPTASCQATVLHQGEVASFTFTPNNRELRLGWGGSIWDAGGRWLLAIAGAFVWGAMHALSPGHGKTIVGAYLVGSRATPQHALFLALATTVTHTAGVFAVGGATLLASHLLSPELLQPWLNLISGLVVVAIGWKLALERLPPAIAQIRMAIARSQPVDLLSRGSWERELSPVETKRDWTGGHHHHGHSHLPPGADGSPVTWQSLLALGISGGILPCPSALVMLLSAVALGSVGLGMTLVVAFSLGLAGVLTAIGLTLVYGRRIFEQLPMMRQSAGTRVVKVLPAVSAMLVVLLGLGITGQALVMILS